MFCDRVVVCSVWVFLGVAVTAQEVAITPRTRVQAVNMPRANLRMDVQMVQIPVTVTDLRGKPLVDLSKTNFRVFEDDVEKPISAFSRRTHRSRPAWFSIAAGA